MPQIKGKGLGPVHRNTKPIEVLSHVQFCSGLDIEGKPMWNYVVV
jgi:hypothetical protein